MVIAVIAACQKEDSIPFYLKSLKAGPIDLNEASPAQSVPVNPTIVAGFTVEVDPATVNSATIKLTGQGDDSDTELTLASSDTTVTIIPKALLMNGKSYTLTISGIGSTDGQLLYNITRSFKTVN